MRTQVATRVLFWIAFGIFLAVSIPHIAWVFHSFEPQGDGFDVVWWGLAYGFAIAIDAVICWLSFIKSTDEGSRDAWLIWGFIATLVIMSWYFNWIYAKAHDPANPGVKVWDIQVMPQWGFLGGWSIGTLTPIIISAMPVFVIAYTYVLNKVTHMKARASKSLAELQGEADEAALRAEAERRIRDARRGLGTMQRGLQLGKGLIDAAQELREELDRKKKDPYFENLEKVVAFFRSTPELLTEQNAASADVLIKELLHLRRVELAQAFRVKAAQELACEPRAQEKQDEHHTVEMITGYVDGPDEIDTLTNINTDPGRLSELAVFDPLDISNGGNNNGNKATWTHYEDETGQIEHDVHSLPGDTAVEAGKDDFVDIYPRDLADEDDSEEFEQNTESLQAVDVDATTRLAVPQTTAPRANSPRYITFEEAATLTGYTVSTLKRKVTSGELKRHPRSKNYVLVSSLRRLKRTKQTEKIPSLREMISNALVASDIQQ